MVANLESELRSIDWSHDGKFIVGGDQKGKVWSFDAFDMKKPLYSVETAGFKKNSTSKKRQSWVQDIKFSPQTQNLGVNYKLAVGFH